MDGLSLPEERLMHRFYTETDQGPDGLVELSREDARHAVTVLRLKPGQHVEIVRNGSLWDAEIITADTREVRVRPVTALPSREPVLSVTLFQGLPKADKMDLIVQKATELGVSRIVPLAMDRCVVRLDPKDAARKTERWRKIAREAGKQSGRCVIPEIADPLPLKQLSRFPALPDANIVPWEEARGYGPLSFCRDHAELTSLGILIGPEGGITQEEINLLRDSGFIPLTLGKRILRTETAGLAAIAAFMGLYGEME